MKNTESKRFKSVKEKSDYFIPLNEKNVEQIHTVLDRNDENVEEYAVIGTIDEEKESDEHMMIYGVTNK